MFAERQAQAQAVQQQAAAAGEQVKQQRSRRTTDEGARCTWTSWDPEVLAVLPAHVADEFPVVHNSGCAMLKSVFNELIRDVAAGRRSFAEWVRCKN